MWPNLTLTQWFVLPGAALSVRRNIRLLRVRLICEGIFLRTRLNGDSRGAPLEKSQEDSETYFENDRRLWFLLWTNNASRYFYIFFLPNLNIPIQYQPHLTLPSL